MAGCCIPSGKPTRQEGVVEPIRRGIEHFLRGRYGYEGYRAFRVLAVPVLIGAILVVGWLLIGPLLTIPRLRPKARWCVTASPSSCSAGRTTGPRCRG